MAIESGGDAGGSNPFEVGERQAAAATVFLSTLKLLSTGAVCSSSIL